MAHRIIAILGAVFALMLGGCGGAESEQLDEPGTETQGAGLINGEPPQAPQPIRLPSRVTIRPNGGDRLFVPPPTNLELKRPGPRDAFNPNLLRR